ncbi:MAG: sigma-70 family RNA polymerase sigma factor [Acidobacteriia bacterium]|nr:sigma-70 family RNA polymerase sigma factor [Terriglobia bacterium]
MGLVQLTEKDLVERTIQGDPNAFNLLVSRWEKRLFNYIYRLVGNRDDALDICQETFLKAYQQISYLRDYKKFQGWLFKIARNFSISYYRSKNQSKTSNVVENQQELDNILLRKYRETSGNQRKLEPTELRLLVEGALNKLNFEQRETVVLKIFEGFKFNEIANILGCPVSTVKSRLYLGLNQLKDILMMDSGEKI